MKTFTSFARPIFESTPCRYKIKSRKEVKQFSYEFFHFLTNLTTFKLHNVDIFHIFTFQTIITIAFSLYSHPLYSNNFFVFSYRLFGYNFFLSIFNCEKGNKKSKRFFCTQFDLRKWIWSIGTEKRENF